MWDNVGGLIGMRIMQIWQAVLQQEDLSTLPNHIYAKGSGGHSKKGKNHRFVCATIMCLLCVFIFSSCTLYRPLNLPQLQSFSQSVHKKYPLAQVSCKYEYGAGVSITVSKLKFDEETAYSILSYLQPIVCDEDFIQALFELFEEQSHGDPNWKNGRRPEIRLYLDVWGNSRYQFVTRATKEGYNSGYDPDSYTWDGYTTWYGTEYVDHVPREITPEEIEEAIERYS